MKNLDSYIDLTSANLMEYGISIEDVADAFCKLLGPDTPCFQLSSGTQRFERLVDELQSRARRVNNVAPLPIAPGMVVISVDANSDEAIAAAGIVTNKIHPP